MKRELVDAYPTAQVVFLAMKRFNHRTGDDCFKWLYLPYETNGAAGRVQKSERGPVVNWLNARVGWLSAPGDQL